MNRKGRRGKSKDGMSAALPRHAFEAPTSTETDARATDHLLAEMDPDDTSVPPVGDLDTDFFHGRPRLDPAFDLDMRDPRVARKMTAGAARRRAHLARYVKGAVGLAFSLCVAAVVKVAVLRGHADPEATGPPRILQAASVGGDPDPRSMTASPSPPVSIASAEPSAEAPAAEAEPDTETAAHDPAGAAQAKAAARSALEGARLNKSIEAGERSVELDPTDGEAWLILGAAYQQKGAWKDARRCYKACVDQGNRGPRAECAAMLR
jgi:tetratricopeptide (TPR) repeat protein